MSDKLFLLLDEDVMVDLGKFGVHKLQYPLITLRRISKALGKPVFGKDNVLMNVTEDVLPELIFQGVCDPMTGDAPSIQIGTLVRQLTLDDIMMMPSSAVAYLINIFVKAYTQSSAPPAKNDQGGTTGKPN